MASEVLLQQVAFIRKIKTIYNDKRNIENKSEKLHTYVSKTLGPCVLCNGFTIIAFYIFGLYFSPHH